MERASFLRRHWLTGIMLLLFASNALLLRQNLQFRRMVEPDFSQFSFLQAGDLVKEFTSGLGDKSAVQISPEGREGRGWLFLYFSRSCRFSSEQLPYWKQILSPLLLERYRVLGLFPDSEGAGQARTFLNRFGLDGLEARSVSSQWIDRLHLHVTPMTLVVDSQGRVERNWPGRWRYEAINDAFDYFGQSAAEAQSPDVSAAR